MVDIDLCYLMIILLWRQIYTLMRFDLNLGNNFIVCGTKQMLLGTSSGICLLGRQDIAERICPIKISICCFLVA